MRAAPLALGIIGLIGGLFYQATGLPQGQQMLSTSETHYAWAVSKGLDGQYDPAALPLYQAIIQQDLGKVEQLLDQGMSPNMVLHPKRYSPLMLALLVDSTDIVDLLVKRGANLNYTADDVNGTVLMAAMQQAIAEALRKSASSDAFYPPDYRLFWHMVDSGADINLGYFETINPGSPHEFVREEDVADMAALLGQMKLVNELLARGYRHDLRRLRETLEIIDVSDEIQPEKDKALETIDQLLRLL